MLYVRRRKKRYGVFGGLCSLCLASILFVGSASAYMMDKESAENLITVGENTIEIVENFQPPADGYGDYTEIPKEVKITNTGSVPCYVRVYLESTYSDDNRFIMGKLTGGYNDFLDEIPMDTVFNGWVHSSDDGWYYYTKPLGVGESTTTLIDAVCYYDGNFDWFDVEDIDVYVYSESVQDMGMRDEFDVDDFAGEDEYDVVSTMYTWYKYWGNASKKTVLPDGM